MDEPIVCGKQNKLSRTSWQHINLNAAFSFINSYAFIYKGTFIFVCFQCHIEVFLSYDVIVVCILEVCYKIINI